MSAAPYLSSVANLSFADLRSWVHNCLPKVSQYQYKAGHNFKSTQLKPNTKLGVFGYYEDPSFLPEVAATLTADWACYPEPADRVRFSTLQFVMHTYPQGFNTWWMQTTNDWLPVGYTGYYPIAEGMFDVMTHKPESISDRALVAPISSLNQSKYLYLFNYSIIPQLQKTEFSKLMMQHMASQIANIEWQGLSAITISENGQRVARRFGLEYRGDCFVDGFRENIFCTTKRER